MKKPPSSISLSKSKITSGIQCQKRLYLQIHEPDFAGERSESQQAIFDQGTQIGLLAHKEFPGGVLIEAGYREPDKAIADTQKAIDAGAKVIFEAAFRFKNVLVRVDVLQRKSKTAPWHLIEVKSSTGVKEQYLDDIAVQAWVLQNCGIEVQDYFVMFINNQCVFPDLSELFSRESVNDEIETRIKAVPGIVQRFTKMLNEPKAPVVDIGPHCDDPYDCEFMDHCWSKKKLPTPNIFEVSGLGKKAWDYYNNGIVSLLDKQIKNPTGHMARAIDVAKTGRRFIDPDAITDEVEAWQWPLYYLDFETMNPAVPWVNGTRPFQQVPFQFSCHIQDEPGGELKHVEYLHDSTSDPRESISAALVKSIGKKGSVVAYKKSAEAGALKHLAEHSKKYAQHLNGIIDRLVDPLPVIKDSVYDIGFAGSFSIKAVAPTLLGKSLSYEDMAVGGGQQAQIAFYEMIAPETTAQRRGDLRKALLEYCKQDTLAMVKLVEWMFKQTSV
jgi:hypothetical protein